MSCGALSDLFRLERETLQRRGTRQVSVVGAPTPSVKALGRLHADVLQQQSQLHDEWQERFSACAAQCMHSV